MAKMYVRYEIATDTSENVTTNYRDAFSEYMRYKGSATLYGVTEMGDFSVIMSK